MHSCCDVLAHTLKHISGCVDLRRLITIPEWLAAPSKYQRYWVRYTVASVAGLWTLRFLYMCGGPFYAKLTHAERPYVLGSHFHGGVERSMCLIPSSVGDCDVRVLFDWWCAIPCSHRHCLSDLQTQSPVWKR